MSTKKNTNLHAAKKVKNDEFYTLLSDIEKEMSFYTSLLKNQTIFCNCDDPEKSNFWKYFSTNFKTLGLKKLISTHYAKDGESSYKLEMTISPDGDTQISKTLLKGNGDFRSPEAVEILKTSDIVITNPPFSLFREFVAQLIEHNKKFLIIGNANSITYKEIFKLIKDNLLWLGITHPKEFIQPDGSSKKFGNINWFTNLNHKNRNALMVFTGIHAGNESLYPVYDNYPAIEVSKLALIPQDYHGVMGVPITFLEKYNPAQFEIIKFRKGNDEKDLLINGKSPYFRILVKKIITQE